MFLEVTKTLTDTFKNERQRLVLEKGRLVFAEKSERSQLLAISVYKVCDATTISRKVLIERYSADGNLLIETMIAEIEKAVSKRMESVYQDSS